MEKIKEFLNIEVTDRDGYGDGSGYGDGYGDGSGSGSGYGYGYGDGSGYGDGDGSGYGDGSGSGYGYGYGYGYGDGSGSGYGYGIKIFNNMRVWLIDGIQTIITKVRGNIARGYILQKDLTLKPCCVAKGNNKFAHGKTAREAVEDLRNKIFQDMDPETAIEMFIKEFPDKNKKYPAKDFYIWHNRLTGSCEMGRKEFIKDGGFDIENDTFTVAEFIEITENAFGGHIIKQLKQTFEER